MTLPLVPCEGSCYAPPAYKSHPPTLPENLCETSQDSFPSHLRINAGLGTPDYGKMHQIFVSLGTEINGAFEAPSAAPTVLLEDQPSSQPSARPSAPSHTPTARPSGPSFSPSLIPTRAPSVSRTPTLRPSRRPTFGPTISIGPTIAPTKIYITGLCVCMSARVCACVCLCVCVYFCVYAFVCIGQTIVIDEMHHLFIVSLFSFFCCNAYSYTNHYHYHKIIFCSL